MEQRQMVVDRLIQVAKSGKLIPYSEVAAWMGLDCTQYPDRMKVVQLLDEISYQENAAGRPLLSAVVVVPEIGYPGRAFFLLARELGLNGFGDDRSLYEFELKRVHSYWRNQVTVAQTVPFMTVDKYEVMVAVP